MVSRSRLQADKSTAWFGLAMPTRCPLATNRRSFRGSPRRVLPEAGHLEVRGVRRGWPSTARGGGLASCFAAKGPAK